jgi:hypothetical protein
VVREEVRQACVRSLAEDGAPYSPMIIRAPACGGGAIELAVVICSTARGRFPFVIANNLAPMMAFHVRVGVVSPVRLCWYCGLARAGKPATHRSHSNRPRRR